MSVAYQRWNLPPKFRHQMDVYQPPADPFDGLSSYRTAYIGRTAPVRPSMKPDDSAHMSAAPLDDVTTVRAAYVRHPLPYIGPKQKAMWLPNPAELDDLTNYRKEYTRKQQGRHSTRVYRIGGFKPRLGLFKRFKRLREYPILKPILGRHPMTS